MRSKIRGRIEGALRDFTEANKLSDDDAQKLFEGAGEITTEGTTINPPEAGRDVLPGLPYEISSIIALACRGYRENGITPQEFVSSRVTSGITMGIAEAEGISANRVSVEIDTTVTTHDNLSEITNRLEQKGPTALSDKEGILLYQNDKINSSELTEILDSPEE